jgi:hypothetical protein
LAVFQARLFGGGSSAVVSQSFRCEGFVVFQAQLFGGGSGAWFDILFTCS